MGKRRLCAVSVDLDEIENYFDIHGLLRPRGGQGDAALSAVYDVALGRIGAFAEARGIAVSLFAVGRDLEREASARDCGAVGAGARGRESFVWAPL